MIALVRAAAWLAALAFLLALHMLLLARADPVVRHAAIGVVGWPAGAPPMRLVLMSDTHMTDPDTPPDRLARVVAIANAQRPDVVLLAGDYVSKKLFATRHYRARDAVAPFAALRPRRAVIAVLGNHDAAKGGLPVRRGLQAARVRVLENGVVRIGALAIGGVGDRWRGRGDVRRVVRGLRAAGGVPILLGHNPDDFATLPRDIPLMLAGHTHCGQIVLPFHGAITTASNFGDRYRCGIVSEHGARLIVTAGIGTSLMPLRLGAPPDLWVVDLGPPARAQRVALATRRHPH